MRKKSTADSSKILDCTANHEMWSREKQILWGKSRSVGLHMSRSCLSCTSTRDSLLVCRTKGILVQEEIFILSLLILQNKKLRPRDLAVVTANWRKAWTEAWTLSLPVKHPLYSASSSFLQKQLHVTEWVLVECLVGKRPEAKRGFVMCQPD